MVAELGGGIDPPVQPSVLVRGGWLLVGRGSGALFAAAFLVIAARHMQPVAFGRLALLLGIATFLGVVAEGGLPLLLVEQVASDPASAWPTVRWVLAVRTLLTGVGGALVVAVSALLDVGAWAGAFFAVAMLASSAQMTFIGSLRGIGRIAGEAGAEVVSRIVTLLAGVAFLRSSPTPAAVTAAYAVGAVAAAALALCAARKRLPPERHPTEKVRLPLRRATALAANSLLVTLYNRLDLWLLAMLSTSGAVGLYAAAYRLYEGLVLPGSAFGLLLAAHRTSGPGNIDNAVYRRHVCAALALTTATAVAIFAGARPAVLMLFGSAYANVVPALRLLCVASLPSVLLLVLSPITALRDRRATIDVIAIGIVLTVLLNLALAPSHGAVGAAAAMVGAQGVMALLTVLRARTQLRLPQPS